MKKILYTLLFLAVVSLTTSAFVTIEKATIPDFLQKDYVHSVFNATMEARFELQFADIFADVTSIDVHQTEEGLYYYVVYGKNQTDHLVVDYFKTDAYEVENEIYDYIQMTEKTMAPSARRCRMTFPPNGAWCSATNPGYVCGVEAYDGGPCIYF